MDIHTALIVPAMTDQAGQCRIVSRPGKWPNALQDYRQSPNAWKEVGLMNSRGRLVCVDDSNLREELQDCEPLMAGLTTTYARASKQSEAVFVPHQEAHRAAISARF